MPRPTATTAIARPMGAVSTGATDAPRIGDMETAIITAACDIRAAVNGLKIVFVQAS